jgi:hypothetical protein
LPTPEKTAGHDIEARALLSQKAEDGQVAVRLDGIADLMGSVAKAGAVGLEPRENFRLTVDKAGRSAPASDIGQRHLLAVQSVVQVLKRELIHLTRITMSV